ncbi:MAG: lactonase family protein [Vicinamibacterales bacterium]
MTVWTNRSLAMVVLAAAVVFAVAARGPLGAASQVTGRLMFVGTYTGPASKGIYAFRFAENSGALTPLGLVAETPSPSFVIGSADGRLLFAVNEVSNYRGEPAGSVSSFSVDRATGKLTLINTESTHGADPCHLALDRTGRFLAVANYSGGNFAIFPVAVDGRLGPASQVLTRNGSGANRARQDAPHAHAVVFDAANRFLVAADLGTDRLVTYAFDEKTGTATPSSETALPPGSGPRHFAFHPTRPEGFSINELASTIATFGWEAPQGRLTLRGTPVRTLPQDFKGDNSTAEIAVHPNGRFLYGSNRGHDSIAVFSISATGTLALVEHEPTRGETPRNFAIDPTGRWLIAANQKTNTLAVFAIDQQQGRLSPVGDLVSVGAPVSILFPR